MPSVDSRRGGRLARNELKIRRALLSASDKAGLAELGRALADAGAELVATGRTAGTLREAGLEVTPIEKVSGSPEAFRGRMKTLSFPVCSGILYRRGDAADEGDLAKLGIQPIDCVVVNFYPFEAAAAKEGASREGLIEEIDIGGPTLVRAAAKNAPDVLVLTDPGQYAGVIRELSASGRVSRGTAERAAADAWDRILAYDAAIARTLGGRGRRPLRYGENPHQKGLLEFDAEPALAWDETLTPTELSYTNILDVSAAYGLASDLVALAPKVSREARVSLSREARVSTSGVVIVKHNNPCGVAVAPKAPSRESEDGGPSAQKRALLRAWEGDPVSAFGGVVVFTDPLEADVAEWLAERFVELVAAPGLTRESPELARLLGKRKSLKAVRVRRFGEIPRESLAVVPGGRLYQTADTELEEPIRGVTKAPWPKDRDLLARFGVAVARSLKSNALAIVREVPGSPGALQLVGAGQGQPNRVEALERLAVPRAQGVLRETGGRLSDCVLVSDAFFPFRDTVDAAHAAGIRAIVQPGGSIKDQESIAACDQHGIAMAFTGVRHFRH